jgi:NAD(P)-dependent dehydrogenase (short-subunit alcohol dehydrogenase family)
MDPLPVDEDISWVPSGKLKGKTALITGGDSGIGRAVSLLFAREGADIGIIYYSEHEDAREVKYKVEQYGRKCLLISGDIGDENFCKESVTKVVQYLGHLDILVNNAGEQHVRESISDIHYEDLDRIFKTNLYSMFFIVGSALPYLDSGASIINTTSITAYEGNPALLDYSTTKGAITAFTRSLSLSLEDKKIRVNGVAPGPIWTPLIPSSFPSEKVSSFGASTPMKRAGQPFEVAPCYLFLACNQDSSYISGQILHPNGGQIVNS